MTRRTLLSAAVAAAVAAPPPYPIIDTHIHLFDPNRPQGIPWPPKNNAKLYKPALPPRFRSIAGPLGVVGAIEVECSPWFDDNQWVLDVMAKDTIMVGMIGNLEPAGPQFAKQLERFAGNPLYLGIRYGNLWERDFHAQLQRPEFLAGLKTMADAGLTLDTANPNAALLTDLLRMTDKIPNLRLVMDHLPRLAPAAFNQNLRELAKRKQVFAKVSGVLRKDGDRVPEDPAFYKPILDQLFDLFGEDRVVYGSDWPNSDNFGDYDKGFAVVRDYFDKKGRAIAEKYFWKNSIQAYRWKKRAGNQPKGA